MLMRARVASSAILAESEVVVVDKIPVETEQSEDSAFGGSNMERKGVLKKRRRGQSVDAMVDNPGLGLTACSSSQSAKVAP